MKVTHSLKMFKGHLSEIATSGGSWTEIAESDQRRDIRKIPDVNQQKWPPKNRRWQLPAGTVSPEINLVDDKHGSFSIMSTFWARLCDIQKKIFKLVEVFDLVAGFDLSQIGKTKLPNRRMAFVSSIGESWE